MTAIFGEIKNFINKKLEKTAEFLKSTLKKLTKIFKKNDTDNEDTKIDDDKKIFNLKKFLKKLKKREGDNDNS